MTDTTESLRAVLERQKNKNRYSGEDVVELLLALATALERVEGAERLAVVALAILGQGSPGSYWIHWKLAARKLLGWTNGHGLFYDEGGNAFLDNTIRDLLNSLGNYDLLHRESRQAALAASPTEAT